MDNEEFKISYRRLPTYKSACEYFRSGGEHNTGGTGTVVTLEEMGWLIGTDVLFKSDADKVMSFLGNAVQELEAEVVRVMPTLEGETTPYIRINGKKFQDVNADIRLPFLAPGFSSLVSDGARVFSRSSVYFDRNKYAGSDELKAFDNLMMNVESIPERENYVRYERKVEFNERVGALSIEGSVGHISNAAQNVQKAILATNNVPKLYNERIHSLTQRLAQ